MKLFSIFEDENGELLEVADKKAREEKLDSNGGVADDVEINYTNYVPQAPPVAKKAKLPQAIDDCFAYASKLIQGLNLDDYLKKDGVSDNTIISKYEDAVPSEDLEDESIHLNIKLSDVFTKIANSFRILKNKIISLNQTLGEQGLINKFDNNWTRAYRKASDGTLVVSAERLTTTNPIDVVGGDTISIHVSEKMADIAVRFFNGDTYNTNYYYVENTTEGVFTVPSGATKAYFNLYKDGNNFPITSAPTTKIYVNNTVDKSATDINSNLLCLNVLGYEVPEDAISWYINQNGRQATVYGGRIDISSLSWGLTGVNNNVWRSAENTIWMNDNSAVAFEKYVYHYVGADALAQNEGVHVGKRIYINNNSTTEKPSGYMYFKLANPYTITIDGNEAISKINDSLDEQGLIKKEIELFQGFSNNNTTAGNPTASGIWVTNKNPISVNSGDKVSVKYNGRTTTANYAFFYKEDKSCLSSVDLPKGDSIDTQVTVPTDAKYIHVTLGNPLTVAEVKKLDIYVNNAIDEIKADLGGFKFVPFTHADFTYSADYKFWSKTISIPSGYTVTGIVANCTNDNVSNLTAVFRDGNSIRISSTNSTNILANVQFVGYYVLKKN